MNRLFQIALGTATGALLTLASACAPDVSSLNVPLEYNPTVDMNSSAYVLPAGAPMIYVEPVDDKRDNATNQIGESDRSKRVAQAPIFATGMSPTEFVHRVIEQRLKSNGIHVVGAESQADHILKIALNEFQANESPNYHASVVLNVTVMNTSGGTLAQGIVSPGQDSTFGKSLSVENYQQVLSNAAAKAVDNLLAVAEFQHALIKSATTVPTYPAAAIPWPSRTMITSDGPRPSQNPDSAVGPIASQGMDAGPAMMSAPGAGASDEGDQ